MKKVKIVLPLYLDKAANMSAVSKKFQEGRSHMGIVCDNSEHAHLLSDLAERSFKELRGQRHKGHISATKENTLTI